MTHGSLFSGIGGFDLASEWMGWENKFHCEWNEFGQKVLHYYWPQAELFTDIKKSNFTKYANKIDILTGGFPCQPYSSAGKRLGKEDDRHLWPEMLRAIQEIRPRWIVGENVRGLTNWNGGVVFDEVQTDLEIKGYEVTPFLLPACAINAPHRRDRIWFIAYNATNTLYKGLQGGQEINEWQKYDNEWGRNGIIIGTNSTNNIRSFECNFINFPSVPPICNGDDGISDRLDNITFSKWRNESIKAGGNAIVPQVAYQIFKSIQEYERIRNTKENS